MDVRRGADILVCQLSGCVWKRPPGTASEGPATGLCLFNDVILRQAFQAGLPVLDLRLICTAAADYARSSPIEPSVSGGGKNRPGHQPRGNQLRFQRGGEPGVHLSYCRLSSGYFG
jgi:hypothetical protein